MSKKPDTPTKKFCAGLALLAGLSVISLLLWGLALILLALLVFFGLSFFTDWEFGARVGGSFVLVFILLKILGFVEATLDLVAELGGAKMNTKPCPYCGKDLRTALAQQCMHCGADWH